MANYSRRAALVGALSLLTTSSLHAQVIGTMPVAFGGGGGPRISGSMPSFVSGQPYSFQPIAQGGTKPYRWSISGAPSGVAIDPLTGLITGTPASTGTATITVTDALGSTFSVTIGTVATIYSSVGNSMRIPVQAYGNGVSITSKLAVYTYATIYRYRVWLPVFAYNETFQGAGTIDAGAGDGGTAGNTLTITAVTKGKLTKGATISGNSATSGTTIVQQLTSAEPDGRQGERGTYEVSVSQARTSGTFTTAIFANKLLPADNVKLAFALEEQFQEKITGLAPRARATFNGGQPYGTYSRTGWDESTGYVKSDWMTPSAPIPAGTKIGCYATWTNPSANKLPSSMLGSSYVNRNEATLIDGTDHVALDIAASATSLPALDSARVGTSAMFTAAFLEIETDAGQMVVPLIGTSVAEGVGVDLDTAPHASFGGPDNKGDIRGNIRGAKGWITVGLDNAQINSVNFAKATDKGISFASPDAVKYIMEGVVGAAGTGAVTVVNEHSINDYFNPVIAHATNKFMRVGDLMYVSATSRCYLITQEGKVTTTPTDETGNEITSGAAKMRYIGTYADPTQRNAMMVLCAKAGINRQIKALIPRARVLTVPTIPGAQTTDNYLTIANQTAKTSWGGPTSQRGYMLAAERTLPTWLSADALLDPNPFCESGPTLGSFVTPGQETSLWHADGITPALHTGNVVLNGSYGGDHPNNGGCRTMGAAVTANLIRGT